MPCCGMNVLSSLNLKTFNLGMQENKTDYLLNKNVSYFFIGGIYSRFSR